jgi:hypothetical protein
MWSGAARCVQLGGTPRNMDISLQMRHMSLSYVTYSSEHPFQCATRSQSHHNLPFGPEGRLPCFLVPPCILVGSQAGHISVTIPAPHSELQCVME